jgi:phosphoglycolate phosphatase
MADGRLAGFDDVVFDLDGTLARLRVDWDGARDALRRAFPSLPVGGASASLRRMVEAATASGGWPARRRIAELLQRFEQPDGRVQCEPVAAGVALAGTLSRFDVISNNLVSTVEQALVALGLRQRCRCIVGFESVLRSKPADEAIHVLRAAVALRPRSLYIGDQDSDRAFASAAGLSFLDARTLCE